MRDDFILFYLRGLPLLFPNLDKPWEECGEERIHTRGPFLAGKPRKLIGLLSNLYLKTERKIRLKPIV